MTPPPRPDARGKPQSPTGAGRLDVVVNGAVFEATAGFDVVTMEVVNASDAARKAHKLVTLSEKMPADAAFARQARRKFT